jgi:hypothetical protein
MRFPYILPLGIVLLALTALVLPSGRAHAQAGGWSIDGFDVAYSIQRSGAVEVTETIEVTFYEERHGIFRDMPIRYHYDDDHDRLISVGDVSVEDENGDPYQFELISSEANLRVKIGDPNSTITGQHDYVISYTLLNALNPITDATGEEWDEFYWNVTGHDWDTTIHDAHASVRLPAPGIIRVACYQGSPGSTDPCRTSESTDQSVNFAYDGIQFSGYDFTVVVAIEKGVVEVGPPVLVDPVKTEWEQFVDWWRITPLALIATAIVAALFVVAIARLWWLEGRDRWFGNMFHLYDGDENAPGARKPMLASETLVVEYEPPTLGGRNGRLLRPAEIGVLMDERADTLDVSASIVDLAVRKHLTITETKSGGIFGLFKKTDYTFDRTSTDDSDLLGYERKLKNAIFEKGDSVSMSSLKNKFYKDLEAIKTSLYKQSVEGKFFPRNPSTTRAIYLVIGCVIAGVGVAILVGLGIAAGGAIVGIPIILGGLLLAVMSGAMPRRTAAGRSLFRRALGFRKFMTTAETERQKFAERENIFSDYLPYAIVFGCVDRWAKAFADLGIVPSEPYWYHGTRPFNALFFANTVSSFSSSVSSTIASTPGGSGGSGFGGGGGSGGGGGGGGGGSW